MLQPTIYFIQGVHANHHRQIMLWEKTSLNKISIHIYLELFSVLVSDKVLFNTPKSLQLA